MTVSTSYFTAPSTSATLNGKRIAISHQVPLNDSPTSVESAQLRYIQRKIKTQYGMARWLSSAEEKHGAKIFRLPDDFMGVSNEIEDEDFDVVGTLIKQGKSWTVETDLEKIETLRRQCQERLIESGKLTIYHGFSNDVAGYRQWCKAEDEKAGKLATRGHGIDYTRTLASL